MPEHRIPAVGARIMDFQDPTRKMSTTGGSEEGTIYVLDEPKAIEKKIKRAVTDSEDPPVIRRGADKAGRHEPRRRPRGVHAARRPEQVVADLAGARGYGDLKAAVAEAVVAELAPVRERYAELRPDEARLEAILAGGRRARPRDRARHARRRARRDGRRAAPARLAPCAGWSLLIGAIVLVDTMLYAALAPLLPDAGATSST